MSSHSSFLKEKSSKRPARQSLENELVILGWEDWKMLKILQPGAKHDCAPKAARKHLYLWQKGSICVSIRWDEVLFAHLGKPPWNARHCNPSIQIENVSSSKHLWILLFDSLTDLPTWCQSFPQGWLLCTRLQSYLLRSKNKTANL